MRTPKASHTCSSRLLKGRRFFCKDQAFCRDSRGLWADFPPVTPRLSIGSAWGVLRAEVGVCMQTFSYHVSYLHLAVWSTDNQLESAYLQLEKSSKFLSRRGDRYFCRQAVEVSRSSWDPFHGKISTAHHTSRPVRHPCCCSCLWHLLGAVPAPCEWRWDWILWMPVPWG